MKTTNLLVATVLFFLNMVITPLWAQDSKNLGVGLRLGDPTGLSIKKYLGSGKALEFNIGNTGYWGHNYRDEFYRFDRFNGYDFISYNKNTAIAIQAHYLIHKDIKVKSGSLQWYYGFGAQARIHSVKYAYRYRDYFGPNTNDYVWVWDEDVATDTDLGADALFGIEYSFKNTPLSVFADVNLFLEILDEPFDLLTQAGIGARYNF